MAKVIYRIMILSIFLILSLFLITPTFFGNVISKSPRVGSLRVVSIAYKRPKDQLGNIGDIVIKFSNALALNDPRPKLSNPIKGSWVKKTPTTLEFEPDKDDLVVSGEKIVIPPGIEAQDGAQLKTKVEKDLTIGNPTVLKLQEALSQMGYLPVRFIKSSPPSQGQASSLDSQYLGKFHWRWKDTISALKKQWRIGVYNSMTKGAVMSFERTHSMVVNVALSSNLVNDIEQAKSDRSRDPDKYSYVFVDEKEPETLKVYEDNRLVYSSLANTGMDNSTPIGTWPVYLRNPSQTLRGTYPNGTPYVIPDVKNINYFNGNFAVHGFKRSSYGWPQSAGCVELPESAASKVWNYLHYGTLVTVAKN